MRLNSIQKIDKTENIPTYNNLIKCHLEVKNYSKVIKYIDHLLDIDSNTNYVLNQLTKSLCLFYLNKYNDSISLLESISFKDIPELEYRNKYLNIKALHLMKTGKDNEALEIIERVLKSDSNDLMALISKGKYLVIMKKFDSAVECFKLANEKHKGSKEGYLGIIEIALCYKLQDKYKQALSTCKLAVNLKKDSIEAYKELSEIYSRNGEFSNAALALENMIKLGYKNSSNYEQIGDLYSQINHIYFLKKSLMNYKIALRLDNKLELREKQNKLEKIVKDLELFNQTKVAN